MKGRDDVQRYTFTERFVHWMVALSFSYLLLTGLALYTPGMYWLAAVFGGGPVIRAWHPIVGVVFFVFLAIMYFMWRRDMRLDDLDRAWLRQARKYALGEEEGLPEAGRFNAGQKMLFKVMVFFGTLLLLSGVPLWFPMTFGVTIRRIAILTHEISFIVVAGAIIVHIYMGTAVVRGSWRAMTTGWVSRTWARVHHPRWYRQVTGESTE